MTSTAPEDLMVSEHAEIPREQRVCARDDHSAVIIYNPHSGRRHNRHQSASRMVDLLHARGLRAESRPTAAPGDATRLGREAAAAGAGVIVVRSGEGTVNEAMQALVGDTVPLAVWPGGTANVLARELDLPRDPEPVADMVTAGRTRRVSVGWAGQRYFLLMAGVGLDAALVGAVNTRLKPAVGQGALWSAGISASSTGASERAFSVTIRLPSRAGTWRFPG